MNENAQTGKPNKEVQCLWSSVNETLMFLEKEGEIVSSVLSLVNQYALDGTNVAINIPRLLLDKIEKQMFQKTQFINTQKPYLLPPMSPLSFDPASEEVYAKSVLCQYPASLPGSKEDTHKQHNQENGCRGDSDTMGALHDLANRIQHPASFLLQSVLPSDRNNVTLLEKVARAVLSDAPQFSEGKEIKLEELIDSLGSNPFLTRNQIPRTPENLRVHGEKLLKWKKTELQNQFKWILSIEKYCQNHHLCCMIKEKLAWPIFSLKPLSDFGQSHSTEEKDVSDCKCVPQKHVVTSHIEEPLTQTQSDLLNKKVICKQDLECIALTKLSETSQMETLSPAVGNRIDVIRGSEEEYTKILDHLQASCNKPSTNKTTLWNSFQISSGISSESFKDTDFGILHETLPEEGGHLSFNSSSSSEANFKLEPNSPMHGGILLEHVVERRQTTPESDFNIQALCSRYEALKKSLSKKREESYLSNPLTPERHKPVLSPTTQNVQTGYA
ncbi:hypothetical protein P7K49_001199 [Saguinus oedipus]|uniref:Uncharacterized protein n=1 Tax=Saguinus oedipus TaxID=9490 RepID=A0ABQ9WGB1_SAGOE|nr:hypothetical protein P7K49_001199 [Saguinus oedipus]